MSGAENLPVWAAALVAIFLVGGALVTFLGAMGLIRFESFYERIHLPTLGTSAGTAFVLLASMIFFSVLQTRFVLHEILIGSFVIVTTPVTLILIARAALYRDRSEGTAGIPAFQLTAEDEADGAPENGA